MGKAETGSRSPVLEEAARELEAAAHDARVAVDCVALGELDRAHTSALTARVAADAAVTALQAALLGGQHGRRVLRRAGWWRGGAPAFPGPPAGQRRSRRSDPEPLNRASPEPGNHAPALGQPPAGRLAG